MGGFFNVEGPVFRVGNLIADIALLSFFWLIFSIPIVTIGASTSALFYVITRRLSDREGYVFREFFESFKANFMLSTKIWLLTLALAIILMFNTTIIEMDNAFNVLMMVFQLFFLAELALISVYVYPIVARFDMGFKEALKAAFFMAHRHLLTSILCMLLFFVVFFVGMWFFPPLLLLAMGIYGYTAAVLVMRVFRKYRPDMDKEELVGEAIDAAAHAAAMKALDTKENKENDES